MGNHFHSHAYFSKAFVPSLFIQQDLEQSFPACVLLSVWLKKVIELSSPSLAHILFLDACFSLHPGCCVCLGTGSLQQDSIEGQQWDGSETDCLSLPTPKTKQHYCCAHFLNYKNHKGYHSHPSVLRGLQDYISVVIIPGIIMMLAVSMCQAGCEGMWTQKLIPPSLSPAREHPVIPSIPIKGHNAQLGSFCKVSATSWRSQGIARRFHCHPLSCFLPGAYSEVKAKDTCVCMCVCLSICIHMHIYICICVYMCMHLHMCISMCTCIHVCACIFAYVCMCVLERVSMYAKARVGCWCLPWLLFSILFSEQGLSQNLQLLDSMSLVGQWALGIPLFSISPTLRFSCVPPCLMRVENPHSGHHTCMVSFYLSYLLSLIVLCFRGQGLIWSPRLATTS